MKKRTEEVILVDETDAAIGSMEKMQAHETAALHRAFSVFIFNDKEEMLLQQRALTKYHSAGLWTNACCSHPQPGEDTLQAATRRLKEELGFETPLTKIFNFTYKATFDNGLTEHEFDHVFIGHYNGAVHLNLQEAAQYAYHSMHAIEKDLRGQPQLFTAWFHIAFPKVMSWWQQNK
jgi:isopentenyl-diphosphate delta-isomerase